jgi:hypothetical protein
MSAPVAVIAHSSVRCPDHMVESAATTGGRAVSAREPPDRVRRGDGGRRATRRRAERICASEVDGAVADRRHDRAKSTAKQR